MGNYEFNQSNSTGENFLRALFNVLISVVALPTELFAKMEKPVNFIKKLNAKWQEAHYEDICQLQVSLVRWIGGKCSPLYVNPEGTIKSTPEEKLTWLRCAAVCHYLTCFFKLFCAVLYIKFHRGDGDDGDNGKEKGVVVGRTVIYLYFAISGFVGTGHLLLKQQQTAKFLNFLGVFDQLNLGLGQFNSNVLMKMIASQAPSLTLGCTGIIAVQQYMQFEKPGSISYPFTGFYGMVATTSVGMSLVKGVSVAVTVYEWWNLTLMLGFCVMPGFCGLFVGFGAVFIGTWTIFKKTRKPRYNLKESFCLYRRLQILVSLVNECFQNDFAIWIMTFLMAWVVVTSAILSDEHIRNTLEPQEFYMCLCLLCEIYCFFVVGFTFPGQAHFLSKRIRAKWRKQLVTTGRNRKSPTGVSDIRSSSWWDAVDRRIIRSYQDVKIRFGSVNFYGRMTALVVTQFVVEKSLKLMLLMKK